MPVMKPKQAKMEHLRDAVGNSPGKTSALLRLCLLQFLFILAACSMRPRTSITTVETPTPSREAGSHPVVDSTQNTGAISDILPVRTPDGRLGRGTASVLAASRDGRLLAVLTPLGVVTYRTDTFQLAWSQAFQKPYSLAFSADNLRLAIGLQSGEVELINAQNGAFQLKLKTEAYAQVAWSPDGKRLLTGAACSAVTVWDAETGANLNQLSYQCSEGASLAQAAWSADGEYVYAITSYGLPIAWDASNYALLANFQPEISQGIADGRLFPSPTEYKLAVADALGGGGLVILDGLTGLTLESFAGQVDSPITGAAWSPDGKRLLVGNSAGSILLWDVATNVQASSLENLYTPAGLAWLPDGDLAAGPVTPDGQIGAVEIANGRSVANLPGLLPEAIYFSWDEMGLVTSNGIHLRNWGPTPEQTDGIHPHSQQTVGTSQAWVLSWSNSMPPVYLFQSFGPQGTAYLVGDGQARWTLLTPDANHQQFKASAWSPDGSQIASGNAIWDTSSGAILQNLAESSGRARDTVAWSPDGSRLATGDSLYLTPVVIWDPVSGQPQLTLQTETGGLSPWLGSLAFSPDGNWLAAGGSLQHPSSGENDGMLLLWDAQTGNQTHLLTESMQNDRLLVIAWSPDGKELATGLSSGKIVLWDMDLYKPIALLQGHADQVLGLAWSPDGSRLASRSLDGSVVIWVIAGKITLPIP